MEPNSRTVSTKCKLVWHYLPGSTPKKIVPAPGASLTLVWINSISSCYSRETDRLTHPQWPVVLILTRSYLTGYRTRTSRRPTPFYCAKHHYTISTNRTIKTNVCSLHNLQPNAIFQSFPPYQSKELLRKLFWNSREWFENSSIGDYEIILLTK